MTQTVTETPGQRRFREKLELFAQERERNLAEGLLSLSTDEGVLVITVSGSGSSKRRAVSQEVYDGFIEEAERLKEARERSGQYAGVVIRPRAVLEQLEGDFADPEVVAISLIGHGSIGMFWTDSARREFDYRTAAQATNRLKQGVVEQRMCAHFPRSIYSVPLGTFTVSRLSNLRAAVGDNRYVPDGPLSSEQDAMFVPVYNDSEGVVAQIAALNAVEGISLSAQPAA
jgi:hypothetical protein